MKKMNKKGFTLMEMLIVVAIIGILIAIAIPTFSSSLTKSKQAADKANIRAAYAEAMTNYLTNNATATATTPAMQAANEKDFIPTGASAKLTYAAKDKIKVTISADTNDAVTVKYEKAS